MDERDHCRGTMIQNTTVDEERIENIIEQLQEKNHLTVCNVLTKFIQCPSIKNQPTLLQNLFNNHLSVILEMIDWMLIPKTIVRTKNIKSNVYAYPYQSKQFLKDNWCFYECLYLYLRRQQISMKVFFKFLTPKYYDPQTLNTSLGYFSEVLIPFSKYQFSGSFHLTQTLIEHQSSHHTISFGIMRILNTQILDTILNYCHYKAIYQFLTTSILISFQDSHDRHISEEVLLHLLKHAINQLNLQQANNVNQQEKIKLFVNICTTFKQMINNIDSEIYLSSRIQALLRIILQSQILQNITIQILKNKLCNNKIKYTKSLQQQNNENISQKNDIMTKTQSYHEGGGGINKSTTYEDNEEEQYFVEILVQILTYTVQIFIKIPKYVEYNVYAKQQIVVQMDSLRSLSSEEDESEEIQNKVNKQKYQNLISSFCQQMQMLLDALPKMNLLVYNTVAPTKTLKFSSGQNIKPITLMKYQYFKLLHSVLIMVHWRNIDISRQKHCSNEKKVIQTQNMLDRHQPPPRRKQKKISHIYLKPFNFRIQKLQLLEIIQKYLLENRWNNITHQILQKIFHLLVMKDYQYLSNHIKNNRINAGFLSFLIEQFTQREYIFLDSFKFTSQGNLHSLYNISKDLAYTLKSTNQLVVLLDQFEPWKKFIMTDLKKYEEKTYPNLTLPELYQPQAQLEEDRKNLDLKVDEVDSIRKLIQNISVARLWPSRNKSKNQPKSLVYRNSGGSGSGNEKQQQIKQKSSRKSQELHPSNKSLERLIKLKIQLSNQDHQKQIRAYDVEQISIRKNIQNSPLKKLKIPSIQIKCEEFQKDSINQNK